MYQEDDYNDDYENDDESNYEEINNILSSIFNTASNNFEAHKYPIYKINGELYTQNNEDMKHKYVEFSHKNIASCFAKIFNRTISNEIFDEDNILCSDKNNVLILNNRTVQYMLESFCIFRSEGYEFYGYVGMDSNLERFFIISDSSISPVLFIFRNQGITEISNMNKSIWNNQS